MIRPPRGLGFGAVDLSEYFCQVNLQPTGAALQLPVSQIPNPTETRMTDRSPLPMGVPALTHPLSEALSAEWPMLIQAQLMLERMIDRIEAGRGK